MHYGTWTQVSGDAGGIVIPGLRVVEFGDAWVNESGNTVARGQVKWEGTFPVDCKSGVYLVTGSGMSTGTWMLVGVV